MVCDSVFIVCLVIFIWVILFIYVGKGIVVGFLYLFFLIEWMLKMILLIDSLMIVELILFMNWVCVYCGVFVGF